LAPIFPKPIIAMSIRVPPGTGHKACLIISKAEKVH
jgi:hypothetical protein